jgi:YVTN family beta-propeller protein
MRAPEASGIMPVIDSRTMKHSALRFAAASAVTFASIAAGAQSRLLIVTQRDQTFHVYDPDTLAEIVSVKEDAGTDAGHEVIATTDGKTAFVPLYGNSGVGKPGSDGDHIQVFDIASAKPTGTITFPHGVRPHKPLWDTHTGMLLVTTEVDRTVSIIDPKTMKVVGSIPTGAEQSHMITLLPDGKKLYSANVGPGTVSVMDVPGRKFLKTIPISSNTQRISNSNDGRWVFTADQTAPELVAIDTKTDTVSKRIKLPAVGYGTTPTVDGRYLLVTMDSQPAIAVVDMKTMEVVRSIETPKGINEVVVTPDGKSAYATSAKTDHLVKIDLGTFTVTKDVTTGKFPDGLWFAAAK